MTELPESLHSFAPNAQIVHIDIDTAAISKNVQVDVPIVADAKEARIKDAGICDLSVRRRSGLRRSKSGKRNIH